MASLTIRNIPERVMEDLRILSERDRRSLNNEILLVLEGGLQKNAELTREDRTAPELQSRLWLELCGRWDDARSAAEIIEDIRIHRTEGREARL
jgi:plasmid stability protein